MILNITKWNILRLYQIREYVSNEAFSWSNPIDELQIIQ